MHHKFDELPEDKKQKMLDAAIREFAEHGYESASTNHIVKEAGISKGLLFHYFGSKKALFLYIFDQCMELTEAEVYPSIWESPDLLERILLASQIKMQMYLEQPLMYTVVMKAMLNMPNELKPEIEQRIQHIAASSYEHLLKGIDLSFIRQGVDPSKAIELVLSSLQSIQEKYIAMYQDNLEQFQQDIASIHDKMREYVDILRYGIYEKRPE